VPVLVGAVPTAQASFGDTTATALSLFTEELGFGLGTTDQREPFQCSIKVEPKVSSVL